MSGVYEKEGEVCARTGYVDRFPSHGYINHQAARVFHHPIQCIEKDAKQKLNITKDNKKTLQ